MTAAAESDPIGFLNSLDAAAVKHAFGDKEASVGFSIASLLTYVIANFTGPSVNLDDTVLAAIRANVPETFQEDLQLNGEALSHLAKLPELIWIPFTLLQRFDGPKIWLARTAVVLQKSLTGPSETLKQICLGTLNGIELAVALRLFHDYAKFLECYESLRKEIDFDFDLVGVLGKRTKFQQDSKAQLVVKVNNSAAKRGDQCEFVRKREQPNTREVKMDEDTATLERVKLDEEVEEVPLTVNEVCLLLLENSAINDRYASETKDEKRMTLLNTVLDYDLPHSMVTVAMFEKSIVEKNDAYAQQRAALQLEAIIGEFDDANHPGAERLQNFFQLEFPPLWEVRREMGMQLLMIGSAKTAANIFIEHQMWDELAWCATVSKDSVLAIETLSKQPETPLVLCLLGELQQDKEKLEKSWEVSKHRFSRAQRSLGRYYIHRDAWKEAINAYEQALALNSLYPDAWFSLGCSRMKLEMWNEAIAAFQQVVSQKQDDAESFSNLAICLMTIGKWQEAHKAVVQAVRFDRKNFKVWENFIVISLGAELINEVLHGVEELVRTNPKWCNSPLLLEVFEKVDEVKGDMQRFIRIMAQISEQADCGWEFYSIYADVLESAGDDEKGFEMRVNVLKRLEEEGKVKEEADFARLVMSVSKLVEATARLPSKKRNASQRVRVLLKKYEEFSQTDSYHQLERLAASLEKK